MFPGQGSQSVGMGADLYKNFELVKKIFKQADEKLNFAISKVIIDGPDSELKLTKNTQPAIMLVSYSIYKLIVEEFKEFLQAEGMLFMHGRNHQEHALKELADLVYVCYQYAENMGWFLDEAMNRVHESNLSKLDEDGKPIYREDGKVLKGPNYKPPDLSDII